MTKERKNVVFGLHAVDALFAKNPQRIQKLCVVHGREDQKIKTLIQLARQHNLRVETISRSELDHLASDENHQGVLAFVTPQKTYSEGDLKDLLADNPKSLLLILDNVQDPHNLGACLRSADAAGVTAVIAPRDKAVGITPTVSKVSCGAAESVPFIQVTNLARTLKFLQDQGVWLYGAAAEATKTLYEVDLAGATGVVLGAEGTGLRRLTQDHCDVLVKIPMQGTVSSLNVSVAAGVFLFESVRQRAAKK
jgi:23S rRNA (guanosine2251-2'-O)-methyltransferase